MGAHLGSQRIQKKLLFEREFRMELELEISESEDYSEFPAEDTVEQRPLCYNCKRRATTVGLCVKKEEKATQTVSRKVWRKRKRKLSDLQQIRV